MLSRSLADRYDWHMRDVPILQWKTVMHDLSPVWGKIYSAHQNLVATWPGSVSYTHLTLPTKA